MDKSIAADSIIKHALPLVPFEGWNQKMLGKAALEAGYKKTDAIRVFPKGAMQAIDHFIAMADRQMIEDASRYHLDTMKLRERIAIIIKTRLDTMLPYREAVRRAVAMQALPFNSHHGLQTLYHTVDAIWITAGDTSTDFSFYTKRLTLGAIYSSTLMHWLNDHSPAQEATWSFLDRRLDNIMQIGKIKARFRQWSSQTRASHRYN